MTFILSSVYSLYTKAITPIHSRWKPYHGFDPNSTLLALILRQINIFSSFRQISSKKFYHSHISTNSSPTLSKFHSIFIRFFLLSYLVLFVFLLFLSRLSNVYFILWNFCSFKDGIDFAVYGLRKCQMTWLRVPVKISLGLDNWHNCLGHKSNTKYKIQYKEEYKIKYNTEWQLT